MSIVINSFSGPYAFLSNFHAASVSYEDLIYPTVEHAFQAAKTRDTIERRRFILLSMPPGRAKYYGRRLTLRPDWERIKIHVMEDCLESKFLRHRHLHDKLLATGDATLIEGNTWGDTFWGVCGGRGENHLGKLLMQLRKDLMRKQP